MSTRPGKWQRIFIAAVAAALFTIVATSAFVSAAEAAPAISAHPHPAHAKPTIVLIHGAFADASGWNAEVATLSKLGYPVYAPAVPLRGLTSDSNYIREFLKTIKGPIILVGHSYGGAIISNAARGVPDVKALVFIDAFLPKKGESPATAGDPDEFPGALLGPDTLTERPYTTASGSTDEDLYVTISDFRAVFAADVSPTRALQEAIAQRPIANAAFNEPSGEPAWKTIPSWQLIGTQDRAIAPARQLFMAERAKTHVSTVKSAHDVVISHPGAVVSEILKAVKAEG